MSANKSTFTFLVKEGEDFQFEMLPFYLNTKSHIVEPLSASSRSTPRGNKKPFGAIDKVMKIDEEIIKIENKDSEMIYLEVERLSPLLDKEDSRLKSKLIALKDESTNVLVDSLNALISKFHSETCKKVQIETCALNRQETMPTSEENVDNKGDKIIEEEDNENNRCDSQGRKLSITYSYDGSLYSNYKTGTNKELEINGEEETELKRKGDESQRTDAKRAKLDVAEVNEALEGSDIETDDAEESETVDILQYAEKIIAKCKFRAIDSSLLQVPSCLKINQVKVEDLKRLLVSTPDKTQTFVGGVVVHNKEDRAVGPVYVYVNQEIFVALKELSCEGQCDTNKIPVVLHIVYEDDPIVAQTFGMFLNVNAKDFGERLHDKLFYQDILRFCCFTYVNESEEKVEEVNSFLKRMLKGLSKGSQNVATFLKFASLPVEFLNRFEEFLRLYETGSLTGQNLSFRKIRNMDKKSERKKTSKVEVPIGFLKLHLKVSQSTREVVLAKILNKKIDLGDYTKRLKDAANLFDTKKEIEKISKHQFEDLKKVAPKMFEDQVLAEFGGAKNNAAGENNKHTKLVKHVQNALKIDGVETPVEQFLSSDHFNMHSLSREFKEFNVIILNCEKGEMKDQEFCLTEQVKDSKTTVGILIKDVKGVREEVDATFSDCPEVKIVYVYIKVEKPVVVDGVKTVITPIVVFGHKDNFVDKELVNFHNLGLQQSLQFVLGDLVSTKEKVLYSFAAISSGMDIDMMGVLKRKGVKISYLAKEDILTKFREKISSRVK